MICLVSNSKFGKGALTPKFDVKAAYRNVPVHPSPRYLLGMKRYSQFNVDLAVSFDLLSAPFTYDCRHGGIDPADFIQDTRSFRYLDDFITSGHPESSQSAHNMSAAMDVCKH